LDTCGITDVTTFSGYASSHGHYFEKEITYFAFSVPRDAHMYGLIIVYAVPQQTTVVYGQQYGEYFGAALTSCDVNNDGRQELIVGAPQWSRDMDEGRVYIFTARYSVCC